MNSFRQITKALDEHKLQVLHHLFPSGKKSGNEFLVGSLRGEPGESLNIHLGEHKGPVWKDFATDESGCDLLGLWAAAKCNGDRAQAMREAAQFLGIDRHDDYVSQSNPKKNEKVKRCITITPIIPVPVNAAPPDFIHPKFGEPEAHWTIETPSGEIGLYWCRYIQNNGKKTDRPYSYCKIEECKPDGSVKVSYDWRFRGTDSPRTLFNRPGFDKKPDAVVLWTEGFKAASAGIRVFPECVSTTNQNGCAGVNSTDWSPVAGHDVIAVADNDEPGRKAAQKVALNVWKVGARSIRVVTVPEDWPDGWDIADPLPDGVTLDDLRRMISEAPEWTPPAEAEQHESGTVGSNRELALNIIQWPEPLHDVAYYGLAGDVVWEIAPHTEADPGALLVQFLVAFGNVIGRVAHYTVEAADHYMNLFVVLVGATSKGRKGTSWQHIRRLFKLVDKAWEEWRIVEGLVSGEGLKWHVRDPTPGKEKGEKKDPGISDKRLLVSESEFVAVLKVLQRIGNTLSAVLRNAWDTGNLSTLAKNDPVVATGAHVSIIGHVTKDELKRNLSGVDSYNGFANRFLWLCVKRSKILPFGGKVDGATLRGLAERLGQAVSFARDLDESLTFDEQAAQIWQGGIYQRLSEGKPGLLGAVTSRAEAQVVRLASIYALLDRSREIHDDHLKAALAVWQYCEDSCRFIFGETISTPVADKILKALRDHPEGLTRTQISHNIFKRNQPAKKIDQALTSLIELGRVVSKKRRGQRGRPTEVWVLVEKRCTT